MPGDHPPAIQPAAVRKGAVGAGRSVIAPPARFGKQAGEDARRSPYLQEGLRLFEEGDYFLAHETLEEHWLEVEAAERDFFQGLIHLAVGFLHYRRDNRKGADLQFRKARLRLASYPDLHQGIDLAGLRVFLEEAPELLERGEPLDPPNLESAREPGA